MGAQKTRMLIKMQTVLMRFEKVMKLLLGVGLESTHILAKNLATFYPCPEASYG